MKYYLFIMFFSCFTFLVNAQTILDTQVELDYHNIRLKTFFGELENNYDINFSYSNISLNKKIAISYNGTLEEALNIVFAQTRLQYKIINEQIVVKKKIIGVLKAKIKGRVFNSSSSLPLMNAEISVLNKKFIYPTISNIDGYFTLKNLPIGRYAIEVKALGFHKRIFSEILISTGKEIYLEIYLREKIKNIEEVVVFSKLNKHEPINKMALTSARTFSVEETNRYAGTISDPARMAQNYAGVSNAGDDSSNDLVIRGNSPRGLLWRLEGAEIPNPNHFGNTGAKGGIISMFSSSILNNSDFYTSTFPAEFGNATSGVFDLRFRKGNNEKREHSLSLSLLGIEASTEGFFSRKSRASYIINYRFSTTNFIRPYAIELKNADLSFQDLSFKVSIPSKNAGIFSFFALGGRNKQENIYNEDNVQLFNKEYFEGQNLGVLGLVHKIILSEKIYLKNVVSGTLDFQRRIVDVQDTIPDIPKLRINDTDFKNTNFLIATTLNYQINKKNLLQIGVNYEFKKFNYFVNLNQNDSNYIFFNSDGNTHFIQSFASWKSIISSRFTINTGFHFSYLQLNKTFAIDPRIGLRYKVNNIHHLSFSTGLYSRPEHISTYLMENTLGLSLKPNLALQMNKSWQTVLSYKYRFAKDYNLKAELYYQYLFDIPVSTDENSSYSTLNSENIFDILISNTTNGGELISEGQGQNYGIDLTIEKYFSKRYYAMFTASIFDSKFKNLKGQQFNTKFSNKFLMNLLGGKEFVVGKHKNNFININAKLVFNGGKRYTPIDLSKTISTGIEFRKEDEIFSKQFNPYYRIDLGFNYKLNTKNTTHTFSIDVQNVTNHKNDYSIFYNFETNKIEKTKQLGIIPFIKYKIEFSFPKKKLKIDKQKDDNVG